MRSFRSARKQHACASYLACKNTFLVPDEMPLKFTFTDISPFTTPYYFLSIHLKSEGSSSGLILPLGYAWTFNRTKSTLLSHDDALTIMNNLDVGYLKNSK